ncbi:hypothetical protein Tco_0272288 [Tanacetum coccineum]
MNQKFLRSLSPDMEHTYNCVEEQAEIDTLSFDDLYNNLKIYEPELRQVKLRLVLHKSPKVLGRIMVLPIKGGLDVDMRKNNVPQLRYEKKTVKPSFAKIEFVKSKEHSKSPRKTTVNRRPKVVVNTAKPKAVLNVVKGNQVNAVKAAYWVWKPKTKVIDHVSKHNSASTILKRVIHSKI